MGIWSYALKFGQYGNKKQRNNKVGTLKTIFITHSVPNRTELNLSFVRVIAR